VAGVPGQAHNNTIVAFQSLVHGQICGRSHASSLRIRRQSLQFQHFQQALLSTASNPSLLPVPGNTVKLNLIGNCNLQQQQ
jgi:hypothetical protein